MIKLANLLKTNIKNKSIKKFPNYLEYQIRINKLVNNLILESYLNKYPLYSSKYLNYKD